MIRDTQIKVSNADTPSLPGFLPTHRPEPRPEPRPGPELPLPSIPAWTGPGIPESGVVEGNEGTGKSSREGDSTVKILE